MANKNEKAVIESCIELLHDVPVGGAPKNISKHRADMSSVISALNKIVDGKSKIGRPRRERFE